jgi:hypothetical protein
MLYNWAREYEATLTGVKVSKIKIALDSYAESSICLIRDSSRSFQVKLTSVFLRV